MTKYDTDYMREKFRGDNYPFVPTSTKESLERYVCERIRTGGFLQAVLENNLMRAVQSADADNYRALKHIVGFCVWCLPSEVWGSPEKVDAWLRGGE